MTERPRPRRAARASVSAELTAARSGTASAAVALLAAGLAAVLSPTAVGAWSVVAVVVAAALVAICAVQARGWQRALGDRSVLRGRSARVSFWLHVVSYPLVLLGMFAMLTVVAVADFTDGRSVIMLFGVVALVVGQAVGATRFLRERGPAGTIRGHLQRLRALERRRTEPPPGLADRPQDQDRSDPSSPDSSSPDPSSPD